MSTVRRIPLYQLMINDMPWVCTDDELGRYYTTPVWPARTWSCLGSVWAEQYDPAMQELFRWTRPAAESAHPDFTEYCRTGFAGARGPHWGGYTKGKSLGWVYPLGHQLQGDLIDVRHSHWLKQGMGGSFFCMNGLQPYTNLPEKPPGVVEHTNGGFQLHAPQVVRVAYSPSAKQIRVQPEEVVVTRGAGAPILWRRADGIAGGASPLEAHMTWSFAGVDLSENVSAPAPGTTYSPKGQFITRHVSPDEVVVIDDYQLPDGAPEEDFTYRISVLDHTDGKVYSLDPKVRNTSGSGSGAGTGGG